MSRSRRRRPIRPATGGERDSVNWLAGVNAANGWPWDLAMVLVGYAVLRGIAATRLRFPFGPRNPR